MTDPEKEDDLDEVVETEVPQVSTTPRLDDSSRVAEDKSAHIAEQARRVDEDQQIDAIRTKLGVVDKSGTHQDPDKKTPEQLYDVFLAEKLQAVIDAWGFVPKIQHYREMLAKAANKNTAKSEKQVVKYLIGEFKQIPFKKWAFFPETMAEQKAVNCSGAALIFARIMNNELGIKTEQADPWGHAANLVTYSDGSTQYVDPRNQVAFDLDLDEPIEKTDGFKIYKVKKRGLEFSLLPVAKAEHGAALVYFENIREMQKDSNQDNEARETLDKYSDVLNPDFAERYMADNFLIRREIDPTWNAEEARVKRIRKLQRVPLLGRLF